MRFPTPAAGTTAQYFRDEDLGTRDEDIYMFEINLIVNLERMYSHCHFNKNRIPINESFTNKDFL
jgi:hypothetical protein